MKKIYNILYLLLAMSTFIACSDEYAGNLMPTTDPRYMNVDKTSLDFSSIASQQFFGINSIGVSWAINNPAQWINLSTQEGSSSASVAVRVSDNTQFSDRGRSATLMVTASGITTRNVSVNQESPSLELTVSHATVELAATNGSSADITVSCNSDWTMSVADDSWLSAIKSDNAITVKASENTTGASRSTTVSVLSGSKLETIRITQKAANTTLSSETLAFGHAASKKTVTIKSDASWTIKNNYSWIDITPAKGSAGTTDISVAVTQNTSTSDREGSFTVGTKEVKVTQEGVRLSVTPETLSFAEAGETLPLTIKSNTTWKISSTNTDISFSKKEGDGDATINVTMPRNTGTVKQFLATVETTDGSSQKGMISISQDGSGMTDITGISAFAKEGGKIDYQVPALSNWTAEVPSDYSSWLHITPTSGNKDATITITVDKTTDINDRSGYFILTYDYGAKYRVLINQYGAGIVTSVSSCQFFAKGGTSEAITVQSLGDVTTSTSAGWLTSELNGNLLTISATENLTGTARTGTVTLQLKGKTHAVTVSVTQAGQHGDLSVDGYGDDVNLVVIETEAVDLGLSVKWATFNVGASKPEEYGDYFAWGETEPYYTDDSQALSPTWKIGKSDGYDWASYKWCNGSGKTLTKYCASSEYGTVDNKTTLELSGDAARANWGGNWRMPTYAEQTELLNNCYWEWTDSYNNTGVKGYIVYKVKNASDKGVVKYSGNSTTTVGSYSLSDNHIFLPAAGYRSGTSLNGAGSYGVYWSSSLTENNSHYAYGVYFLSSDVYWSNGDYRYHGQGVRAVCP